MLQNQFQEEALAGFRLLLHYLRQKNKILFRYTKKGRKQQEESKKKLLGGAELDDGKCSFFF